MTSHTFRWLRRYYRQWFSPAPQRRSRPHQRAPGVESLEDRSLLSAVLVADVNHDGLGTPITGLTAVGSHVVFEASLGSDNTIPVVFGSDGSTATPLAELPSQFSAFAPAGLTGATFNGALFFINPADGTLWATNGTAAGTGPLGLPVNGPSTPMVFNGALYFTGTDAQGVPGLYKSNGTPGNAQLVFSQQGAGFQGLLASSTALYFTDGSHVYQSDGTTQGTAPVANSATVFGIGNLTVVGSSLYYLATDQTSFQQGLYKVSGGSTSLVTSGASNFLNLTAAGNNLYYV